MAIGAIEALKKYGFNESNSSKYINVVGIGGSPAAKELIDKGIMTGTVIEDLPAEAKAIYDIGLNWVYGNAPLHNTSYKFDESGTTIKIAYFEYVN